jgi:hypothetical protein
MGPYMELKVPSSFYRVDAGLHALSFSPGGALWRHDDIMIRRIMLKMNYKRHIQCTF